MPSSRASLMPLAALTCSVLMLAGAVAASASPSRAASPSPAASVSPSPVYFPLEVWLDRPMPTTAEPGTTIQVGATFWDPQARQLGPGNAYYLRVLPAAGSGPASEVVPVRDQPWHVTATLVVPQGGLGELQVGQVGSACTQSGCTRSDVLYRIAGVGPPPDAPLTALAAALIEPFLAAPEAGTPVEVAVELDPKVDWAPDALPTPDRLYLRARVPRGPVLVEEPLARDAVGGSVRYAGTLTLPEQGPYVLDVATVPGAEVGDVFASSTTSVSAVSADGSPAPAAGGQEPPDGSPDRGPDGRTLLLALGGVAAVSVAVLWLLSRRRVSS